MELSSQAWSSLRAHALRAPLDKIRANLKAHLPTETSGFSDAELLAKLDGWIDEADIHGLRSEYQIFIYAAAVIVYGTQLERCEDKAYLHQLLADPRHDAEMKTSMLKLRIFLDTGHRLP